MQETARVAANKEEVTHEHEVSRVVRQIPICQRFPDKHVPCLLEASAELVHSAGKTIVAPGAPATSLFVIAAGSARVVMQCGAQPMVLRTVGPGDLFGLGQVLEGQPYYVGLEAVTVTRTLVVDRESLFEELLSHPDASLELLNQLAASAMNSISSLVSEVSRPDQLDAGPRSGPPQPKASMMPSDRVLEYLRDHPEGADWDALEQETGLRGHNIVSLIGKLMDRGLVRQEYPLFCAVDGAP